MKIFVANMSTQVQDMDLVKMFSAFGRIESAKVIKDHATGLSKGYGFVEMPREDEALAAIDSLHRTEIYGKRVIVDVAKMQKNNKSMAESRHNYRPRKHELGLPQEQFAQTPFQDEMVYEVGMLSIQY